jgi:hypothetical protein
VLVIYMYIILGHALVHRIGSGLELHLQKIFFKKLKRGS